MEWPAHRTSYDFSMSATQTLNSLGFLAATLKRSVTGMRRAILELQIEPAAVINGIEHFTDAQADAIRAHLDGQTQPGGQP